MEREKLSYHSRLSLKRVHLIGLGALGGIYAAQILKSDPSALIVIAHGERAKKIETDGFYVNGQKFSPIVESTPKSFAELIIVAVKYPQLKKAMEDMKDFVGPQTTILSFLNGISSEEILAEKFGAQKVIYSYGIEMDALKKENTIQFKSLGRIVFGEKNNATKTPRIQEIENFFIKHHVPYEIPEDMIRSLWFKFMLNAGVNQASTILEVPFKAFHETGEARDLMVNIAKEVMLISQKLGINLSEKDLEHFVEIINRLNPVGRTSMLQDLDAKRETEVDYFAGKIIELGRSLGLPTPFNEKAYELIKKKSLTSRV